MTVNSVSLITPTQYQDAFTRREAIAESLEMARLGHSLLKETLTSLSFQKEGLVRQLRRIDPSLVGENRTNSSNKITQLACDVFFTLKALFAKVFGVLNNLERHLSDVCTQESAQKAQLYELEGDMSVLEAEKNELRAVRQNFVKQNQLTVFQKSLVKQGSIASSLRGGLFHTILPFMIPGYNFYKMCGMGVFAKVK